MPASEGWHVAGMTDFMNYSTKQSIHEKYVSNGLQKKLQEQIFECRESDSPKGEAQDAPNQADRFLRKVSQ